MHEVQFQNHIKSSPAISSFFPLPNEKRQKKTQDFVE
jgi:hypothetical protein